MRNHTHAGRLGYVCEGAQRRVKIDKILPHYAEHQHGHSVRTSHQPGTLPLLVVAFSTITAQAFLEGHCWKPSKVDPLTN